VINPPQPRQINEDMAIVLTPLVVLIATSISWLIWRQTNTSRDYLFFFCLVGILLSSVLLGVGFRYYKTHPFVGLLTALTLFSLFPASQAANSNNAWQFVAGMVTGLGGGALTITFLVLSLKTMNHGGGSAASSEASHGPDTPDARWFPASGGSETSHHVTGVDWDEEAWRIFSRDQ
jgi:hypothetical protein